MLGSIRDSSVSGVFRMRPVGRAVAGCHGPRKSSGPVIPASGQKPRWQVPSVTVDQTVADTRVDREADGDLVAPVTWPVPPCSVSFQQRAAFYSSTLITLPGGSQLPSLASSGLSTCGTRRPRPDEGISLFHFTLKITTTKRESSIVHEYVFHAPDLSRASEMPAYGVYLSVCETDTSSHNSSPWK